MLWACRACAKSSLFTSATMVSVIVDPQLDPDDDAPPCAPPPSPEYFLRHDTITAARLDSLTMHAVSSAEVVVDDPHLLVPPMLEQKQENMELDPPTVVPPKRRPSIKRKKGDDWREGRDIVQEWGKKLRPSSHHQPPPVVPFYLPADPWR